MFPSVIVEALFFIEASSMAIAKFTALKVEKTTRPGLYNDGGGLYLRVAPGGSKGWIFRYRINGRTRDMGLGELDPENETVG
jgi:hypothetical protein